MKTGICEVAEFERTCCREADGQGRPGGLRLCRQNDRGKPGNPKSLVRNRAMHILAANAQWDEENRFDAVIADFLAHITDEKPITARQCIKALAQVGLAKPQYIPQILSALRSADLSPYRDSMRPLIEKDIAETERILTAGGSGS